MVVTDRRERGDVAETEPVTMGAIIRAARLRRGWSQMQLAEEAGIGLGNGAIVRIERTERVGSFLTVAKLARALDLDLNVLARYALRQERG